MATAHPIQADPFTKLERKIFRQLAVRPYIPVQEMIDGLLKAVEDVYPEAITNVVKHAGVGKFSLRLFKSDEYLQVSMHDNGKGSGLLSTTLRSTLSRPRAAVVVSATVSPSRLSPII